ncbi:hypothetical protein [Vibrio crassostreae]|uniref:hypothetical protein n=1 Tax=Vibrio crassostreae TaxID=246167 RepID=UPI001B314390|nr:hypothetical protein [Vibrio crassostreae]
MFFGIKTIAKVVIAAFIFVAIYSFGACSDAYIELVSDLSKDGVADFFDEFKECSKPTEAFEWLAEKFEDSGVRDEIEDKVEDLKDEAIERLES